MPFPRYRKSTPTQQHLFTNQDEAIAVKSIIKECIAKKITGGFSSPEDQNGETPPPVQNKSKGQR